MRARGKTAAPPGTRLLQEAGFLVFPAGAQISLPRETGKKMALARSGRGIAFYI
jgi:hypothetical protein